ncbi:hypothetical protein [Devosia sp.]|uniref:hypothetical protein n=1 Tax=Devosia sp. TaxID=1871048 RepID=UPI002FC6E0BC
MENRITDVTKMVMSALRRAAKWQAWGWLLVKALFIVGASALAAYAQFMTAENGTLTTWHVIGAGAAIVAGLGGLILAVKEKDSANELTAAHEALEVARSMYGVYGQLSAQEARSRRLTEIYLAVRAMRSVLESAPGIALSDVQLVRALLTNAERSLSIAMDFKLREHWTITIYRADLDAGSNRQTLIALATYRSLQCNIRKARRWPEGIGFAGICYASGMEVAVPDAHLSAMAAVVDVGGLSKEDDKSLYRSMFAAPILIQGQPRPWGVVAATSSRADHFETGGAVGIRNAEAVRLLADMVALALAVQNPAPTVAQP